MVETSKSTERVLAVLRKRRLRVVLNVASSLFCLVVNVWYLRHPTRLPVVMNVIAIVAAMFLIVKEIAEYQLLVKLRRAKQAALPQ